MMDIMKNNFALSHNKDIYTKEILFHSHDYYEIYFFADGNVKYYVENESYELKKGDVLLIPPGKLHRPVIEENIPYERYVLWIYNSYLAGNSGISGFISGINGLANERKTHLVSFAGAEYEQLRSLLDNALYNYCSKDALSGYVAESCIILILEKLKAGFKNADYVENVQSDIVRRVIGYLNENFVNSPTLDDISAEFFVSKYYLSHRFKEYTKTSVHNYILMKKINLAKELLKSGKSPQNVSEQCGFSTYSNFYKAFIGRTGVSPGSYIASCL